MKRVLSALVVLMVLCAAPALAGQAEHRQATEELLELTNMPRILAQTMDGMIQVQMQQNPDMAMFEDVMRRFLAKHMGWESLKEDMVGLYMEAFTEQEVRDMIAFYRTPTGRKTVEMAPVLMARGAEIGQKRVMDNIDELQQMLAEKAQRLGTTPGEEPSSH